MRNESALDEETGARYLDHSPLGRLADNGWPGWLDPSRSIHEQITEFRKEYRDRYRLRLDGLRYAVSHLAAVRKEQDWLILLLDGDTCEPLTSEWLPERFGSLWIPPGENADSILQRMRGTLARMYANSSRSSDENG